MGKAAATRDASTRSTSARFNEGLLGGMVGMYHLDSVDEGIATYEIYEVVITGPGELQSNWSLQLMKYSYGKSYISNCSKSVIMTWRGGLLISLWRCA